MALEKDFFNMAETTVSFEALSTTFSEYGAPTFSTSTGDVEAHVEIGDHVVVTPQNTEQIATATVYVMSSSMSVGVQDRITLADGEQPVILRVDVLTDDEGQHHLEVHTR
jgi:hypothetical protein